MGIVGNGCASRFGKEYAVVTRVLTGGLLVPPVFSVRGAGGLLA